MKRLTLGLLVVAIASVFAACGGDDSSGSGNSGQTGDTASRQGAPSGSPPQLSEEFKSCLAEQGVDVPDPGSGPPQGGQAPNGDISKAIQACQDKVGGGFSPPSGGNGPPDLGGGTPGTQVQ